MHGLISPGAFFPPLSALVFPVGGHGNAYLIRVLPRTSRLFHARDPARSRMTSPRLACLGGALGKV